jgi:hypothetical protein
MIWDVDATWLLMAFGAVFALSYMLTLMLESSLGGEGFGPFGNAALITVGFFLGITTANYQGISISELKFALMIGLTGAFALTLTTFLIRGIWARL